MTDEFMKNSSCIALPGDANIPSTRAVGELKAEKCYAFLKIDDPLVHICIVQSLMQLEPQVR